MWLTELAIDWFAAVVWRGRGVVRYISAMVAVWCGGSYPPVRLCASRRKIGNFTEFSVAMSSPPTAAESHVAWFYHQYPSPDVDCWHEFCALFRYKTPPRHVLVARGGNNVISNVCVELQLGVEPRFRLTCLETQAVREGPCMLGDLRPPELFNVSEWETANGRLTRTGHG